MRKKWLSIAAALLAAMMLPAVPAAAAQPEAAGPAEWTVLFYLCGSDLESKHGYATETLIDLGSVITYPAAWNLTRLAGAPIMDPDAALPVNVVVQTGGSREWHTPEELNMNVASDRLQRWHLQPSTVIGTETVDPFILDEELPLASMSDPETLADFIRWGAANYPAKKYVLVLWDHGGGAKTGVLLDELFNNDIMYLDELHQAMAAGGVMFETILFDACLMANLETACAVQEYARWMVASEDLVGGKGTAVEDWVQQLYFTPQWDGERLGRWICDATQKKIGSETLDGIRDTLTWSVIDLTHIPRVLELFDRFFEWVGNVYKNQPDEMRKVCSFLTDQFEFGMSDENMVDLAQIFYQPYFAGAVDYDLYSGMLDALMDAVVYTTRSTGRAKALGLSFYDIDGNIGAELQSYGRNCPSPHYLAFLDAITPGWNAPAEIYEKVEKLPEIHDYEAYQLTIEKALDWDGTPALYVRNGYPNLRLIHADLYRLDDETGNFLRLGSSIVIPDTMHIHDYLLFVINHSWGWLTVEDEFCDAELVTRYDLEDTYNIPMQIGSDQHVLRIGKSVLSDEVVVYGLWEGYDNDSRMFSRTSMSLSEMAGREFYLLYPIDEKISGGRTTYETSKPMTLLRTLEIEIKQLPAGTYRIDYWAEDSFTHHMEIGKAAVEWNGEEATLLPGEEWKGLVKLIVPDE